MSNTFVLEKDLVSLANVIVPEIFRSESPQYFGLIKAFLANIQEVQDNINDTLLQTIDFDKITEEAVLKLYFDTFLQTLGLDESNDLLSGKDLLKISKDLSELKGTTFLYNILANLLVFLLPAVKNRYAELKASLDNPGLTQPEIDAILAEMESLRLGGFAEKAYLILSEDATFQYSIESDIDEETFNTYIKPFCHPAGWELNFLFVIFELFGENITTLDSFSATEAFITLSGQNGNNLDGKFMTKFYQLYSVGNISQLTDLQGKVIDPARLFTVVFSNQLELEDILDTIDLEDGSTILLEFNSELVLNGTFDTNTTSWTAVNSSLASVLNELEITSIASMGQAEQVIPVSNSLTYNILGDMRGDGTAIPEIIVYDGPTSASPILVSSTGDATVNTNFNLSFIPTGTDVTVALVKSSVGGSIVYFDNISIPHPLSGQVFYNFGQLTTVDDVSNRLIEYDASTTNEFKTTIKYEDSAYLFPQELYDSDMKYYANHQSIKANGGAVAGHEGRMITLRVFIDKDKILP